MSTITITKSDLVVRCNAVAGVPEQTVGLLWAVGEAVSFLVKSDESGKTSGRSLVADCGVSQSTVSRGVRLFEAFPASEAEARRAFRNSEATSCLDFVNSLSAKAATAAPVKKVSATTKAANKVVRDLSPLTLAQKKAALKAAMKELGIDAL